MKNYIFLLFSLIVFSANAQITESRDISPFKSIDVKSGVNINYHLSNTPKVIIETDKKENLNYIITKITNNVLEIYIDSKKQKTLTIDKIEIDVYGDVLDKILVTSGSIISFEEKMKTNQLYLKLTSGSQVVFKDLIADNLELNLSSGSQLKGKISTNAILAKINSGANWNSKIKSKNINITISSGSKVDLIGEADVLELKATSGSYSDLKKLKVNKANLVATNSSSINCWVDAKLFADANSASNIMIKGQPNDLTVQKDKLSNILNENGQLY